VRAMEVVSACSGSSGGNLTNLIKLVPCRTWSIENKHAKRFGPLDQTYLFYMSIIWSPLCSAFKQYKNFLEIVSHCIFTCRTLADITSEGSTGKLITMHAA